MQGWSRRQKQHQFKRNSQIVSDFVSKPKRIGDGMPTFVSKRSCHVVRVAAQRLLQAVCVEVGRYGIAFVRLERARPFVMNARLHDHFREIVLCPVDIIEIRFRRTEQSVVDSRSIEDTENYARRAVSVHRLAG